MEIVVDAQIVGWCYQSHVLDRETECSCDPSEFFARLGGEDVAFLDDHGKVEGEWRRQADPDWFDAWIAERMNAGDIVIRPIDNCADLVRKIRNDAGFPASGKDKWYVCVAHTRSKVSGEEVALISEDVDFFEPKSKNNKARTKFLKSGTGGVAKILRKHKVDPRTVVQHLS